MTVPDAFWGQQGLTEEQFEELVQYFLEEGFCPFRERSEVEERRNRFLAFLKMSASRKQAGHDHLPAEEFPSQEAGPN